MSRIIWLFGLPCSGKTTLATALRQRILAVGQPAVLLDGDDLRSGLCADLGFSDADRCENLRRAAHVAALLALQENTVVCAFVTPKEHHRALVRQILGPQVSFVHIDCPLEVCVARDVKGMYARAAAREISGMTGTEDAFERPDGSGLTVQTQGLTVAESLEQLLTGLKEPAFRL